MGSNNSATQKQGLRESVKPEGQCEAAVFKRRVWTMKQLQDGWTRFKATKDYEAAVRWVDRVQSNPRQEFLSWSHHPSTGSVANSSNYARPPLLYYSVGTQATTAAALSG